VSKPWERQDGESAKAFEAFKIYRDMGPERSLSKLEQSFNGTKSKTWLGEWSRNNGWVERVEAFDSWLDQQELQAMMRGRLKAKQKRIERAGLMQSVGEKSLKKKDTLLDKKTDYTLSDDRQLIADGMKAERSEYGENDENQAQSGGGVNFIQINLNGQDIQDIIKTAKECGVEKRIVEVVESSNGNHHNGENGKD